MPLRGKLGRLSLLQRARSRRSAGPGRSMPPMRAFLGRRTAGRPTGVAGIRYARMARGGFFKSLGKIVSKVAKSVTKVPVIGAVAKAALGSLPIVGQVVTAVNAFKGKTPVGIAASPVGGVAPINVPGPPMAAGLTLGGAPRAKRRKKAKKRKAAPRRKAKAKKSKGGSAKQRAARARFAKAAKRGRIKKGQRL